MNQIIFFPTKNNTTDNHLTVTVSYTKLNNTNTNSHKKNPHSNHSHSHHQNSPIQSIGSASGSNSRTFKLSRSRRSWWRCSKTSEPCSSPWSQNHHNKLLTLLTVTLCTTDEVEWPWMLKLNLCGIIIVLLYGVWDAAIHIVLFAHLQHWVFSTIIFPNWGQKNWGMCRFIRNYSYYKT